MLAALLITSLLGCAARRGGTDVSDEPSVFGWKLVPGVEMTYSCTTSYLLEGEAINRIEHWSYLVRAIEDDGAARLEGRLTGLGAGLTRGGIPLEPSSLEPGREEEVARLSERPVSVHLAMDGWIQVSAGSWADRLPHRMLGMTFPAEPLTVGVSWPDPAIARPFADLMPVGMELEVAATHRLEGLYLRDERVQAHILTDGYARPTHPDLTGGITLSGETWWDLAAGQMIERTLDAELRAPDDDSLERLQIALRRVE